MAELSDHCVQLALVTNLVELATEHVPGQPDYALGFKKTSYLKFLIGWIG